MTSPSGPISFVSMYMTLRSRWTAHYSTRGIFVNLAGDKGFGAAAGLLLLEIAEGRQGFCVRRDEFERLLVLPPGLGEESVGFVEVSHGHKVAGIERLELGGAQEGVLRPLLPAVVRVSHQGLAQEPEHRGVPIAVGGGELAVADAIEVVPHLEVVPGLGKELLGH